MGPKEGIVETATKTVDGAIQLTVKVIGPPEDSLINLKLFVSQSATKIRPGDVVKWIKNKVFWTPSNNVEHTGREFLDFNIPISMKVLPWKPKPPSRGSNDISKWNWWD